MTHNIIHFHNVNDRTPFTPKYSYKIFINDIKHKLDLDLYKDTILFREKEIIKQSPYTSDWGTGLGSDSLTSRADTINILEWKEFESLKNVIRTEHDNFLNEMRLPLEQNLYVQCWANVLRKGQFMNQHHHSNSVYAYLSGHLCIQVNGTSTCYVNPMTNNVFKSENIPGRITLFESWIPHYTEKHDFDEERITIAFDILPELCYNEDIFDHKKSHWIKI